MFRRYHTTPWHARATLGVLAVVILVPAILARIVSIEQFEKPLARSVFLSFLTFHIPALGAVLFTLFSAKPATERKEELRLALPFTWSMLRSSFILVLQIIPLTILLLICSQWVIDRLHLSFDTFNPIANWLTTGDIRVILALTFGAVVIAPFTEEIIFRLIFHRTIAFYCGFRAANIITSFVFAVIHQIPENVLPLFILALVLQQQFNKTQNLWVPISLHALYNAMMLVIALIGHYFN